MPNVEIDGTNSTVKTNVLTSQSASAITVPTGKVLTVTDAAGLTVAGSTVGALDTAAVATAATAAAQYAIATQVPPSTSGKVLTSNGSAWTSATPAGGGDLVFLAEDTAGAATKEFTSADGIDTSVYDNYLFQFEGVWPTTQGSDLQCTFYSDDGSTALTSAVYRYVVNGTDTNGVELRHSSTNATTMNLTPSGDMRASGTNFGGGKVWLKLTSGSNYWTHHLEMDFVEWATNDLHTTQGHFRYFGSTALPAVKFHTSSGNINGTIRMYGLKKS